MTPTKAAEADPRRWLILAVIAVAQLMVVLDATIVNIALPSAQRDLAFSTPDRQWVLTAYTLAFGGLLLVGGRLSDLIGRRTTFIAGLIGFALASAAGGAAPGFDTLIAARAVQGAFGAILAPSALALLTTTFTDTRERARALGVYTAVAGAGGAVGLLLGGILTEYLSWRWSLYVNVVFALAALTGALALIGRTQRADNASLDVAGSVLAAGGLIGIVYGLSEAGSQGWSGALTVIPIVAGIALLAVFVVVERRVAHPLVPLGIITDRTRGGAYLGTIITGVATIGVFLLITYYLQGTLGYTPLKTGLAFLPFIGGLVIGANVVSNFALERLGPKLVVPTGMVVAAAGAVWLSRVGAGGGYATVVAPGFGVFGIGASAAVVSAFTLGPAGAAASDTGVASALVNASNQIGASLGAALLNTIAANATVHYLSSHHLPAVAAVHGDKVAFLVSGVLLIIGAIVTAIIFPPRATRGSRPEPASPAAIGIA
jgi:EmrB/QacA subfamily drug resistance transporter